MANSVAYYQITPFTLVSLPPGVMLHNRSTVPRDSAIDIDKTSQKGVPEREQPNGSVVIKRCVNFRSSVRFFFPIALSRLF